MGHVVELSAQEVRLLKIWLKAPIGGYMLPRVTFEAVEGGGILVRTMPYVTHE